MCSCCNRLPSWGISPWCLPCLRGPVGPCNVGRPCVVRPHLAGGQRPRFAAQLLQAEQYHLGQANTCNNSTPLIYAGAATEHQHIATYYGALYHFASTPNSDQSCQHCAKNLALSAAKEARS